MLTTFQIFIFIIVAKSIFRAINRADLEGVSFSKFLVRIVIVGGFTYLYAYILTQPINAILKAFTQ